MLGHYRRVADMSSMLPKLDPQLGLVTNCWERVFAKLAGQRRCPMEELSEPQRVLKEIYHAQSYTS